MIVPGLLWWLAFSPATMTQDSLAIWGAVRDGNAIPEMPFTYWAYVEIASLFGHALALVTLIQVLGLTTAIWIAARTLRLGPWAAALTTAVVMASPFGGLFAMALWKDVPTTILIIVGAVLLVRGILKGRHLVALLPGCISLFLAGLMRFESPFILLTWAGVLLILALFQVGPLRMRVIAAALALGVTSVLALVVASTVQAQVVGGSLSPWFKWKPAIADLAYVAAMEPLDQGDPLRAAHLMVTGEALVAAKKCDDNDSLFRTPGFDPAFVSAHEAEIAGWWARVAASYPHLVVRAHLCRGSAYLPPPLASDSGPYAIWNTTSILQPNDLNVSLYAPAIVRVPFLLWNSVWSERAGVIAWPGLLGLLGTVSLVFIGRWSPLRVPRLVFAACIWGSLVPFAAWTVLSDYRYVASAQLLCLVTILAALAGLASRKSFLPSQPLDLVSESDQTTDESR